MTFNELKENFKYIMSDENLNNIILDQQYTKYEDLNKRMNKIYSDIKNFEYYNSNNNDLDFEPKKVKKVKKIKEWFDDNGLYIEKDAYGNYCLRSINNSAINEIFRSEDDIYYMLQKWYEEDMENVECGNYESIVKEPIPEESKVEESIPEPTIPAEPYEPIDRVSVDMDVLNGFLDVDNSK